MLLSCDRPKSFTEDFNFSLQIPLWRCGREGRGERGKLRSFSPVLRLSEWKPAVLRVDKLHTFREVLLGRRGPGSLLTWFPLGKQMHHQHIGTEHPRALEELLNLLSILGTLYRIKLRPEMQDDLNVVQISQKRQGRCSQITHPNLERSHKATSPQDSERTAPFSH